MITAFFISLIAGLATAIGGLLATHKRMVERPFIAVSLAFAAGAMVFVSFTQVIPTGVGLLGDAIEPKAALVAVYASFFVGILLVLLIDRVIPKNLNPSELEGREVVSAGVKARLARSGLLIAAVLALHNFPEGASTFVASYHDVALGVTLAVAIAVHNIPEGIAVAAPIYAATKSRKKAFLWALFSGVTEPIGAVVAALLITFAIPTTLFGLMFGLVAGMMTFIALDELLPAARRYQTKPHQSIYGMFGGMLIVAVSIVLLMR